nr:hypothetical protein B0A51_01685 [Rachicladosporium sp. CCFEE 5018]
MYSNGVLALLVYTALVKAVSKSPWLSQRRPLRHGISDCSAAHSQPQCVPSDGNVTFGPLPEDDQLFSTYYVDIAPYPITADRTFFAKVQGYLQHNLSNVTDANLADATLSATMSASFENGREHTWGPGTVPLRTQMIAQDFGYLAIRNETGHYVDHLSLGYHDILVDGAFFYASLFFSQLHFCVRC